MNREQNIRRKEVRIRFSFLFLALLTLFTTFYISFQKLEASVNDYVNGQGTIENGAGGASLYTLSSPYSAKGNPATLSTVKGPTISFGHSYYHLNLDSPKLNNSNIQNYNPSPNQVASHSPNQDIQNLALGVVVPLGEKLHFGLSSTFPSNSLAKIYTLSGNDSFYLTYNPRFLKPEIFTALSYKLPYGFSIGGGAYYGLKTEGDVKVTVTQNDAEARMFLNLKPSYSPYFGLLYKYVFKKEDLKKNEEGETTSDENLEEESLSFGSFYRHSQKAKANINFSINFDLSLRGNLATIPFQANSELMAFFDPAIYGFGANYKWKSFHFFGGGELYKWSHYEAPIINLSGKDLITLTGNSLKPEIIELRDSVTYRIGVSKENGLLLKGKEHLLTSSIGFEYHESALPKRPQSLAIIDSSKKIINIGEKLTSRNLSFINSLLGGNHQVFFGLAGKYTFVKREELVVKNGDFKIQSAEVGGNIFTLLGEFGVIY